MKNEDFYQKQQFLNAVVREVEDNFNISLKIAYFPHDAFCIWGLLNGKVLVTDTYCLTENDLREVVLDLEALFNLELTDYSSELYGAEL